MNSDLNNLDFDVNTLIPYDQFNWDCIEGIECVTNDLNIVWQRAVSDMAHGLSNVENVVANILNTLQNHLVGSIDITEALSREMLSDIQGHVQASLVGVPNSGGMGSKQLGAWLVWRELEKGSLVPVIEVWDEPPISVISMGPYSCVPLLCWTATGIPELWSQEITNIQLHATLAARLRDRYDNAGEIAFNGINWRPTDICLDYPIGQRPIADSHRIDNAGCMALSTTSTIGSITPETLPIIAPTESLFPTPTSNPLNGPIPNGEYSQYPVTPILESNNQTATPTEGMPMHALPIQKLEDTTGTTSETISGDCCKAIVAVLAQIRDRLTHQSSDNDKSEAKATATGGIPDDQYLLSSQYETDIVAYWQREGYDTLANLPTNLVYNVRQITELFADDTPNIEEIPL